jgi:uncharacterized protein (TIGR03437 family)
MYRLLLLLSAAAIASAQSFEAPALQISKDIQARHLPFGTILSPVFTSPDSKDIVSYSRCGDSAIWTGHYLAAEAFRYAVTHSPESAAAARQALNGIRTLVDVTGADRLLARCVLHADSPLAAGPRDEEKQHGEYRGTVEGIDYYWIGDTSRDQYLGVFFGLSVAYEQLPGSRAAVREIATKLIDRLLEKNWSVVMPDGAVSTVFWLRPDQVLSILQVGRQVNPDRFAKAYDDLRHSAVAINTPIRLESLNDHDSYYKFNLDAISIYNLLRLEEESFRRSDYIVMYRTFHNAVANHGNAFFNVIDRAILGPNATRDAETIRLMAQWLERPRRDFYVDLRGKYKACGDDRACDPISVPERVRTDFLWQRSPYLLYGGGSGRIETPGIDFILPYWMGRYYGLDFGPLAVSAASASGPIAPDSIASLFGAGMPDANAQVTITDAAGTSRAATVYYSGREQINFVVPASLTPGQARIEVRDAAGTLTNSTTANLQRIAPTLFTANASGKGVVAALAFRLEKDGSQSVVPVFRCIGPLLCIAEPLEARDDRPLYLSLYGTGIRGASSLASVRVTIGGTAVPVQYAGPQQQFAGLDQINFRLPGSLNGKGETDLILTVDGVVSNTVRIGIH